ncbi:MAG TPA: glycerol-3-phosphate acyltransferase [Candidatus Dormibacteraeota bacterium]
MIPPHWLVLTAGALAGGYVVGSLPVAWLVVRHRQGVDLRHAGRGGTGTVDALVLGGVRAAVLTIVLELIKGAVVGLGARVYDGDAWFAATAIAGCVVGDAFPLGIRQGRRGAVPLVSGVIAALPSAWWAGLIIALPAVVLLGLRGRAFEQLVALCVPLGLVVGTRDLRTLAPAAVIVVALIARHRVRERQRREAQRVRELAGPHRVPLVVEPPPRPDSVPRS